MDNQLFMHRITDYWDKSMNEAQRADLLLTVFSSVTAVALPLDVLFVLLQ